MLSHLKGPGHLIKIILEKKQISGTTRDRTLELETELEEQRIIADTLAENLGGGTGELTESQMATAASKDYRHLVLDNYLKNIHASIICKYQHENPSKARNQ